MPDLVADTFVILRAAKTTASEALDILGALAADLTSPGKKADMLVALREKVAATQEFHFQIAQKLLMIERWEKASDSMRFEPPVYWRYLSSGGKEGPYCPQCWDLSRRAVALNVVPFRGHDRWACRTCSKTYFSDGAKAAMNAAEQVANDRRRGPNSGLIVED